MKAVHEYSRYKNLYSLTFKEALQKPHLWEMGQADLFKLEALGRGRKIVESSQGRESFDFSE